MKSRKSSKVKTVRLFNRYAWLVDTIYRHGKISFEEINKCWLDAVLNEDEEDIPLRTFHDHREAIQELFDVNIECDKRDGYKYYIEHTDDMRRRDIRNWMLNSFTVNNLMNECRRLKNRILFEDVPSGQRFLAPIIEAMRDGLTLEMTCKSFKWSEPEQFELQPYCLKLFKQRWYVLAQTGNYDTRNDWDNSFNYELNVFPLDWIQDLQQTDKPFDLPENFCPESYFHNAYGVQAPLDETFLQPCTVELKVRSKVRKLLQTLPLHHSQQETEVNEEYSIFSYFLCPTEEFAQEILRFFNNVEVLSPKRFRSNIIETIKEMNSVYEK